MSPNERQLLQNQHSGAHPSTGTNVRHASPHSGRKNGTRGYGNGLQASTAQNQHKSQSTRKLPNSFPQSSPHRIRQAGPKDNSPMHSNKTIHPQAVSGSFDLAEKAEPALTAVTWPEHFARFPILAQPLLSRTLWSPKRLSIARESGNPIREEPSSTSKPLSGGLPWSVSKLPYLNDARASGQPSSDTSNRAKPRPTQETSKNKKRQVGR